MQNEKRVKQEPGYAFRGALGKKGRTMKPYKAITLILLAAAALIYGLMAFKYSTFNVSSMPIEAKGDAIDGWIVGSVTAAIIYLITKD